MRHKSSFTTRRHTIRGTFLGTATCIGPKNIFTSETQRIDRLSRDHTPHT